MLLDCSPRHLCFYVLRAEFGDCWFPCWCAESAGSPERPISSSHSLSRGALEYGWYMRLFLSLAFYLFIYLFFLFHQLSWEVWWKPVIAYPAWAACAVIVDIVGLGRQDQGREGIGVLWLEGSRRCAQIFWGYWRLPFEIGKPMCGCESHEWSIKS